MSLKTRSTVTARCDRCGFKLKLSETDGHSVSFARHRLEVRGWSRRKSKTSSTFDDVCPLCESKHQGADEGAI